MSKFLQQLGGKKIIRPVLVFLLLLSPVLPGQANVAHAFWTNIVDASIGRLFAEGAQLIFNAVAWIVAQIGYLLDHTVELMVLEMAELVSDIGAIDTLWTTFRDLGNIVFIGVLLYIAIRTILNVGNDFNTKRILVRLVIVALFVNFSLFATKVVIDTSNVVALQFYNSIQVEECGESACNISHFFADVTSISSVQSPEALESIESEPDMGNTRIFIARSLGIVFLLVAGFVMAAMALLLVVRFGFLLLLMIASPLAFIAFILPSTSKMGERWMHSLFNQSFFAPVLFAMIYVVAVLGVELKSGLGGDGDLMAAILDPNGDNIGVILTFILMIILMAYTLVVAKQMGAAGASQTIKIGKQARNAGQSALVGAGRATGAAAVGAAAGTAAYAGRSVAGRYGNRMANSAKLKQKAAQGGAGGWIAEKRMQLGDKMAGSSFDVRNTKAVGDKVGTVGRREGGYRDVVEEKEKQREETKKQIESLSAAEKQAAEEAKLQKDKLKDQKGKLDEKISNETTEVNRAINNRNQLRNKLAEARKNNNDQLETQLKQQLGDLEGQVRKKIRGVDNIDDLEKRRDRLDERKRSLQGTFKQKNKDLDKIINVGQERGEEFIETMMNQQSTLDKIRDKMSLYSQGDIAETTTTQSNRSMAVGNLGDVKNRQRKRRLSRGIAVKQSNETIQNEKAVINNAIQERDRLRNELAQAQKSQDNEMQKKLNQQFNNLSEEVKGKVSGIDDLNDLENRRDVLDRKSGEGSSGGSGSEGNQKSDSN